MFQPRNTFWWSKKTPNLTLVVAEQAMLFRQAVLLPSWIRACFHRQTRSGWSRDSASTWQRKVSFIAQCLICRNPAVLLALCFGTAESVRAFYLFVCQPNQYLVESLRSSAAGGNAPWDCERQGSGKRSWSPVSVAGLTAVSQWIAHIL